MDRYLVRLHKKSDRHKRQFALLTAGTITLFIFGVWSVATFLPNSEQQQRGIATNGQSVSEVSPFQSLRMSLANSISSIKNSFGELKSSLEKTDLEAEYKEMKTGALDTYGQ